jgi:hypothetical protein
MLVKGYDAQEDAIWKMELGCQKRDNSAESIYLTWMTYALNLRVFQEMMTSYALDRQHNPKSEANFKDYKSWAFPLCREVVDDFNSVLSETEWKGYLKKFLDDISSEGKGGQL